MTDTICNVLKCEPEKTPMKKRRVNLSDKVTFLVETTAMNKKPCAQYKRGCREQLDLEYKFSSCNECLVKTRAKDTLRRKKAKEKTCEDGHAMCPTCCQEQLLAEFVGEKKHQLRTKTCKTCRDANKKQDANRDNEQRNKLARKAEAKPERKEKKKEWNEANHDKVVMKGLNYRQRQLNDNPDEYRARNAKTAAIWRNKNEDKTDENNTAKKNSREDNYKVYSRCANLKNLSFELSYDDYLKIVNVPCYYCDCVEDDKGFNGIDRLDSVVGYAIDNCVSCCRMCNFMKGSLDNNTFVNKTEHILTYNGLITDGNSYPECFANHKGASFCQYKWRAFNKQLEFVLTSDEFTYICSLDCYICGKNSDEQHRNGIDRVDNALSYTTDNSKSCCGECNYMKRDYKYEEFMIKCKQIFANCKEQKVGGVTCIHNIVANKNKKTNEEIALENAKKKKSTSDEVIARYNDEEYKLELASQLTELRMMRKNDIGA